MRIIKPTRLREYWTRYPQTRPSLEQWLMRTKAATWASIADLRQTFPRADPVRVTSGRTVVVFNIAGNRYRLLTAIHPTFKGPDSPCHLFRLGKLHTTRHRGPVRHR